MLGFFVGIAVGTILLNGKTMNLVVAVMIPETNKPQKTKAFTRGVEGLKPTLLWKSTKFEY